MKKAVILFNLGGPDKLENVKPFLFNLFTNDNLRECRLNIIESTFFCAKYFDCTFVRWSIIEVRTSFNLDNEKNFIEEDRRLLKNIAR